MNVQNCNKRLSTNSEIYVRNDLKLLTNTPFHRSPKRLQCIKRRNATERFAVIQKSTCAKSLSSLVRVLCCDLKTDLRKVVKCSCQNASP